MTNLFSVFDPTCLMGAPLNWVSVATLFILTPSLFWASKNQISFSLCNLLKFVNLEFEAIFGASATPGSTLFMVSLFLFLMLNNFLGLLPYVFTSSSHLSFTVALALPLWLGHMTYASFYSPNSVLAHLVPLGTPVALMPFMVLIETVSSIIRPLTLSVRLAANMVAGHLLLTLLSSQSPSSSYIVLTLILSALCALGVLEAAVAIIQAYVFSILSALYVNEVNPALVQ